MSQDQSVSAAPLSARVNPRLVAVNVVLLGVLAFVTFAGAQPTPPGSTPGPHAGRGRGEYTMVSGRYSGATTSAIYILDSANQELVVLGWDRSAARLNPIGHRSLADDAQYLTKPR